LPVNTNSKPVCRPISAAKKAEVTLTIWFMAPKDETVLELAYSGAAAGERRAGCLTD
jgi:hypothetical protein